MGYFSTNTSKSCFSLTSPVGDQGFPGQLDVEVSYELTEDNQVVIHHTYQSTEACPVNLANHIYFNLAGRTRSERLWNMIYILMQTNICRQIWTVSQRESGITLQIQILIFAKVNGLAEISYKMMTNVELGV